MVDVDLRGGHVLMSHPLLQRPHRHDHTASSYADNLTRLGARLCALALREPQQMHQLRG